LKFIDEVTITVISGNGGEGCSGMRREKHVPLGGPDGGDGGNGGDVYVEATDKLNTLVKFRGRKVYRAKNGENGSGQQCHGKYGDDLVIPVPIGTIVRKSETQEVIADLTEVGQRILIAEGGRGGLGNANFKTSTNQAPRKVTAAKPGEQFEVDLELKLLADIALIGMPNAGKSTLISVISAAKPKIADYPFTTLEPNLGVVAYEDSSYVVADIPGLIEDAAEGKGLGIKFLKHIERTKAFVHLVDVSWCLDEFEAFDQYVTVRAELEKYSDKLMNKPEIICLTKIDAMTEEEITKIQKFFEEALDKKVLPLSSVSGRNVDIVKALMLQSLGRGN
tara:strand:+ start:299 stop:1303 length:1005 start_codon:yes stop_codon:yes gene_type:complete